MTLQDNDQFLVSRGNTPYSVDSQTLVANLQDSDLMVVCRSGTPYKATGAEIKDSLGSGGIFPSENDITISPSVPGTGTQADPFILATRIAAPAGSTVVTSETITFTDQPPSTNVVWTDNSTGVGTRFSQPVTQTDANGDWSGQLQYADSPDSTADIDYVGDLQIGLLHFRWQVDQKLNDRIPTDVVSVNLVDTGSETGPRFTDQTFAFTSVVTDGFPLPTKTIEAHVDGSLRITPETSEIVGAGGIVNVPGGWNAATTVLTNKTLLSVAYGSAAFIAPEFGTTNVYRSDDGGETWGITTAPEPNQWRDVTFGNGRFVGVASNGATNVMYSDNGGYAWVGVTAPRDNLYGVAYGGGTFVAVSTGSGTQAVYSTDNGTSWTGAASMPTGNWVKAAYGLGSDGVNRFVAVGSSTTNRLAHSENGINWTSAATAVDNINFEDVCFGDGKFVAVGSGGSDPYRVYYSTDGINWTGATSPINTWKTVTYGDGKFVAISQSTEVMWSTDAVNWTSATATESANWSSVTYGNGRFVAVANGAGNNVMWSEYGNDPYETQELTLADNKDLSVFQPGDLVQQNEAVTALAPAFSTTLYTGNGSTQTITNGIDLAGSGGLVWSKCRSISRSHSLVDTVRGVNRTLESNSVNNEDVDGTISAFYSDGYEAMLPGNNSNFAGNTYVSWCFRKAPKFFDVVEFIATEASQDVPHNLQTAPGFWIVKNIDRSQGWFCGHKDLTITQYLPFSNNPVQTAGGIWGGTPPTNTTLTTQMSYSGEKCIAYLFADEPGLIKCGEFTGSGQQATVTTGFEPQWILFKSTDSGNWNIVDSTRGMNPPPTYSPTLFPNTSATESNSYGVTTSNSGFSVTAIADNKYIYVAISADAMADATVTPAGLFQSTTGNTITLTPQTDGWSANTGKFAKGPEQIVENARLYLKFDSNGAVSGLQSSPQDPPYTTTTTNPSLNLTFPSTFPSGETPDDELPDGTTLSVGIASENATNRSPISGYEEAIVQPKKDSSVSDWFSTTIYDGNGEANTQSLTTGIDLLNGGGLTWIKPRDEVEGGQANRNSHVLVTNALGDAFMASNDSQPSQDFQGLNFTDTGYVVPANPRINWGGVGYVSWNFKAAPKFFDVQTYVGGASGSSTTTVQHDLDSIPAMMICKGIDSGSDWAVYHKDLNGGINPEDRYLTLNNNGGEVNGSNWGGTPPTTTEFTVSGNINASINYVAYLFADEPGLIKCGKFTDPANNQPITVDCGFAPQWLLVKAATVSGSWQIVDTTRGWSDSEVRHLVADTTAAEAPSGPWHPTATGFTVDTGYYTIPLSSGGSPVDVIYVAIAAPVVDTMTAEQFVESQVKFLTYDNRKEVKVGEDAIAKRDEVVEQAENLGINISQVKKALGK